MADKKCLEGCEYCKPVYSTGGWRFYGCFAKPYNGKWVSEIKDCPLIKKVVE